MAKQTQHRRRRGPGGRYYYPIQYVPKKRTERFWKQRRRRISIWNGLQKLGPQNKGLTVKQIARRWRISLQTARRDIKNIVKQRRGTEVLLLKRGTGKIKQWYAQQRLGGPTAPIPPDFFKGAGTIVLHAKAQSTGGKADQGKLFFEGSIVVPDNEKGKQEGIDRLTRFVRDNFGPALARSLKWGESEVNAASTNEICWKHSGDKTWNRARL